MAVILFVFGAALGSFLNVLSLRYDPDAFLLAKKVIGGRSACPKCRGTLRWYELVPILSFLVQRGRCRRCGKKISAQYPIVEIACGLIFVFVPRALVGVAPLLVIAWTALFVTLLLITLIDARLHLIPDEATIFVAVLGAFIAYGGMEDFGLLKGSFIGPFAALFELRDNIWLNRVVAAGAAGLFFSAFVLGTRGRGMGIGDIKLAAALGLAFGWPDIILIVALSFIAGSIVGLFLIALRRASMKRNIAFGPFLAVGAVTVFFCGERIVRWYFSLFPSA